MKTFFRKIIVLLICLLPLAVIAQDAAPKTDKTPATSRAQRKKAKQKWKEDRKIESGQAKAVKEHHKKLQTKKTNKSMLREKRKSDRLRANKKDFFLVRWFKYKKH